jgi:hypothetical protein
MPSVAARSEHPAWQDRRLQVRRGTWRDGVPRPVMPPGVSGRGRQLTSRRVMEKVRENARRAALPVSAGDASGLARLMQRYFRWVLGVPGLLPVPLAAAGFCDWVGASGTGWEPGRRSRRPQGVLDAAARERIMLGGKGAGRGRGGCEVSGSGGGLPVWQGDQAGECLGRGSGSSQPYLGPRGVSVLPRRQDD